MGNWQIDSYSLLSQGNSYARIDIVLDRYQANSLQENTRTQYSKKKKKQSKKLLQIRKFFYLSIGVTLWLAVKTNLNIPTSYL